MFFLWSRVIDPTCGRFSLDLAYGNTQHTIGSAQVFIPTLTVGVEYK